MISKWQVLLAINWHHLSVAPFNTLLGTLVANEKRDYSKAKSEIHGKVNYLTKQVFDLYFLDQWILGV